MPNFTPTIHPWNQEVWQNLTLDPERSNHALLFNGDQGLGKIDLGFALAHYVLTENHSQSEQLFNSGSHPDFHVIMPEFAVVDLQQEQPLRSMQGAPLLAAFAKRYLEPHGGKPRKTITIDQIRNLGTALITHPHISSTRVVFIAHAETMNRNAANALLKNLEEPPQNTLFIVASDEISKLAKTIRSRCSLINFRAPDAKSGQSWLEQQSTMPAHEVANHLAMANNNPLLALRLFQQGYITALKGVFTDVNGLWNRGREPVQVAKNFQEIGAIRVVNILQKLATDLLRFSLSDAPNTVFFPVQETWVKSVSKKVSTDKLVDLLDQLVYAKKMLSTTVDELLVLETVSIKLYELPS